MSRREGGQQGTELVPHQFIFSLTYLTPSVLMLRTPDVQECRARYPQVGKIPTCPSIVASGAPGSLLRTRNLQVGIPVFPQGAVEVAVEVAGGRPRAAAGSSHFKPHAGIRKRALGAVGVEALEPQACPPPRDKPPLTRPHLLILPKKPHGGRRGVKY